MSNLNIALLITAIGMGLVFASILALWGFMALLMWVAARFSRPEAAEESAAETASANEASAHEQTLRRQAAIAAVAVAMAREAESELHEFPLPPTAIVSAWQAVMRGNIIRKRGNVR